MFNLEPQQQTIITEYDRYFDENQQQVTNLEKDKCLKNPQLLIPVQKEGTFRLMTEFIESVVDYAQKRNNISFAIEIVDFLHAVTLAQDVKAPKLLENLREYKQKFSEDRSSIDLSKPGTVAGAGIGFEMSIGLSRWNAVCTGDSLAIWENLKLHHISGRKVEGTNINRSLNKAECKELRGFISFVLEKAKLQIQEYIQLTNNPMPKEGSAAAPASASVSASVAVVDPLQLVAASKPFSFGSMMRKFIQAINPCSPSSANSTTTKTNSPPEHRFNP